MSDPINLVYPNSETEDELGNNDDDSDIECQEVLSDESIIRSGYLKKKGQQRKTWKKRWFVLKPSKLAYYKNDKEYELCGYIDLSLITAVSAVSNTEKRFIFGLVTKERTFFFQLQSEELMLDWIYDLRNTIQTRKSFLLSASAMQSNGEDSTKIRLDNEFKQDRRSITPINTAIFTELPSNLIKSPLLKDENHCETLNSNYDGKTDLQPASVPPISILQSITSKYNVRNDNMSKVVSFSPIETSNELDLGLQQDNELSSSEEEFEDELMSSQGSQLIKITTILHQGFLLKQKSQLSRSQWKSEWFVFRNNKLSCYKDEKEYETKRIINIQNILDIIEVDAIGKQEHCFKIVMHKKGLTLSADSEESRLKWIQIIKKRLELFSSV